MAFYAVEMKAEVSAVVFTERIKYCNVLIETDVLVNKCTYNIGINHGFQCSNIRWITRKVFEHKAAGRVFKHLPSDPANV